MVSTQSGDDLNQAKVEDVRPERKSEKKRTKDQDENPAKRVKQEDEDVQQDKDESSKDKYLKRVAEYAKPHEASSNPGEVHQAKLEDVVHENQPGHTSKRAQEEGSSASRETKEVKKRSSSNSTEKHLHQAKIEDVAPEVKAENKQEEQSDVVSENKTEKKQEAESKGAVKETSDVKHEAGPEKTDERPKAHPEEEVNQNKQTDSNASEGDIVQLKKHDDTDDRPEPVKINRAPVLHLFAACVAHFQHPKLPWETCLSLGSAVSSVCALAKGRAIGQIEPRDENKPTASHDDEEKLSVMQFDLPLKNGKALIGHDVKQPNEGYLKGKFKDRYNETRELMQEALETWKGDEDELAKKAFHMYERFRPSTGWGQSGEMDLKLVRETIMKK